MEVTDYEIRFSMERGYFIAAYDEETQGIARVSEQYFPTYSDAAEALATGEWTPA